MSGNSLSLLALFGLFSAVLWFANSAEKQRQRGVEHVTPQQFLSYSIIIFIQAAIFGLGGLMAAFGALINSADANSDFAESVPPDTLAVLENMDTLLIGFGMWVPALFGLLFLLKPVRQVLAKVIPIDPDHHVHAIALSMSVWVVTNLLVTLGFGLDALADSVSGMSTSSLIISIWVQNAATALLAFLGAGWIVRRNFSETLARLKLEVPTLKQVGIGLAAGFGLMLFAGTVGWIGTELGLGSELVDTTSEAVYGPFFSSFIGILTLSVAAPIGEEILFRGALQPRFGRILTAILFAIVHGNYGLSLVTVIILVVGYALGVIRDRTNTTTSIITHSFYNFIQAIIAFIALQYGI